MQPTHTKRLFPSQKTQPTMEICLRPIALGRPNSGPPGFDAESIGLRTTGLGCAETAGLEGAGIGRFRMTATCADINGGSAALGYQSPPPRDGSSG